MAKPEDRAVDAGIAQLKGKDDTATVEWWKQRFALIAGIPTEVARAGALLPQMRELSRLPETERRRLTKLRIQAFTTIPSDQRQVVMSARKLTYAFDAELVKSDDALVQQLASEVPGAADLAQQMRDR